MNQFLKFLLKGPAELLENPPSPIYKFTVVGCFESSSQIFCAHVIAKDETEAVYKTPKSLNSTNEPEDLVIVAIFKGHHKNLNECGTLSNYTDWPR